MKRDLTEYYRLLYAVLIELIGPVFNILIYFYSNNICYGESCILEFYYYAYNRYLFIIAILLFNLLNSIWFYVRRVMKKTHKQETEKVSFDYQLVNMLKDAIKQ